MGSRGAGLEDPGSRFEQFLEFAPDAIVGIGPDGAIVVVNAQAEALFGYTRAELLEMKVEALVPERFHAVHPGHRAGYFADPRTRPMGAELELFGVRSDGTEFPAEISLSSIETEDGLLAIAAIRDITERIEAQRTKEQLEAQVAEARRLEEARDREMLEAQLNQLRRLESVGQLAGGIAHDFNNILGVIINYAQFVEDDLPAGSAAADDVQEIRRAAERAAALTRQLLIFSRREVVRPQVLDLNVVVSELDKLLRRALGEHIELETRFSPEPVTVEADPGQIEQVLVNLAVNARDAMPSGGRLVIETSNVELDAETLRPELSPGRYARLTVSDTGTGMTREVAAHAFDPFFTTKPSGEGTGLGLATVYGIVTEAGGDVRLYSEPGIGTTVRVELPAIAGAPAQSERVKLERPAGRGETVLVVEDEDGVRKLVQRVLETAGYDVMVADRGAAALEILEERPDVDLLLTDVVMPEMLGPELVAEASRRLPDLKILYMSGYIHQVIAGLDADTTDDFAFIEKPFTGETLRQAVRSALDVTAGQSGP
jgi:PAS domain S-box-containing protein